MNRIVRLLGLAIAVAAVIGLIDSTGNAQDDQEAKKPKHTVKEVMAAHKGEGNLLGKVKSGSATSEEKQQLVDFYISLYENEPPQGDVTSWKQKSGAALMSAVKVMVGREGAVDDLKTATNCAACHKVHKPK